MNKEVLFRCSGVGALMTDGRGAVITENQLAEIKTLEDKVLSGKGLTDNQKEKLQYLKDKRDAPPELSDTAKRFIEQTWLLNEKGFYKELDNKYITKGLFNEEDAIEMLCDLDGIFYVKNTERITKGSLTGECDIRHTYNSFEELPSWRRLIDNGETKFPLKVIKDTKASWDPLTFLAGDLSKLYEWQGRGYLHNYDADEFHLEYLLTDAPPHLYESERRKIAHKFGIIDPDLPEYAPLFDQLRRNMIYSDNPAYTMEERRKTFVITRDLEKEKALLDRIGPAISYYNSIKLNQKPA